MSKTIVNLINLANPQLYSSYHWEYWLLPVWGQNRRCTGIQGLEKTHILAYFLQWYPAKNYLDKQTISKKYIYKRVWLVRHQTICLSKTTCQERILLPMTLLAIRHLANSNSFCFIHLLRHTPRMHL